MDKSPIILCLESSTQICSVAVLKNGQVASLIESHLRYRHGEWLTTAIDHALDAASASKEDISALSITTGPGSYTGLRVGLATAKAFCMALGIPLITHSSLEVLAYGIRNHVDSPAYVMPMMDARRMEVYTAIFNSEMEYLVKDTPLILDEVTCRDLQEKYSPLIIGGDGARKSLEFWPQKNFLTFSIENISAAHQACIAWKKFSEKNFQDIAYVSPIYLKKPNITKPKRTL